MRWSALGLVTGLVAGLALAFDGFLTFIIVLLFGAIGLAVGKMADGELDLGRFRDGVSDGVSGLRSGVSSGVSGIRGGVSGIRGGGRPRRRDRP